MSGLSNSSGGWVTEFLLLFFFFFPSPSPSLSAEHSRLRLLPPFSQSTDGYGAVKRQRSFSPSLVSFSPFQTHSGATSRLSIQMQMTRELFFFSSLFSFRRTLMDSAFPGFFSSFPLLPHSHVRQGGTERTTSSPPFFSSSARGPFFFLLGDM